jgi:hypothetical protein
MEGIPLFAFLFCNTNIIYMYQIAKKYLPFIALLGPQLHPGFLALPF